MKKSKFLYFLFGIAYLLSSCSTEQKPFIIPPAFDEVNHNPSRDEVLKLRYKDHLIITVTTTPSKMIKSSGESGADIMKIAFESRFPQAVNNYNGYQIEEMLQLNINDHPFISQVFMADESGIKLYYQYGMMYINEIEEYYEIIISGRKHYRTEHAALIKSFLEGIYQ